jgi:hypothetical protein
LAAFFQSNENNNDYYKIWLCLSKLQNDNDRDVRDLAKVLQLPETASLQLLNDMAIDEMKLSTDRTEPPDYASSDGDHISDEENKNLYGLFNSSGDDDDTLADLHFDFAKSAGITDSNKNVDDVTILFASSSFENENSLFSFSDELPPATSSTDVVSSVNNSFPPPPPEPTNDCDSNKNFEFNPFQRRMSKKKT